MAAKPANNRPRPPAAKCPKSWASPPPLYPLQATASIPVRFFSDRDGWPADLYVIPEHSFAVDTTGVDVALSDEHTEIRWLPYNKAAECLRWNSNRVALGELHERLTRDDLPPQA